MAAINLEGLQRANVTYQNVIHTLPLFAFNEVAAALGISIFSVVGAKDVRTNRALKSGLLRPYTAGCTPAETEEIMKFTQSVLEPQICYGNLVDDITNYKDKIILSQNGEMIDHKSKKHPAEYEMIKAQVGVWGDDVSAAMYFGERNDSGATPLDGFTGFYKRMDLLVTSGLISAKNGNLVTTGAITAPADDTDTGAFTKVVAFLKAAHPSLRASKISELECSESVVAASKSAYRNMVKAFQDPTTEQWIEALRNHAGITGKLVLRSHPVLGVGSRMVYRVPGMLDFGRAAKGSHTFVQIRAPFANPNKVQFWMQDAYDTRINDVNRKVFQMNDQSNTAPDIHGDYKEAEQAAEQTSEQTPEE